MLHILPGGLLSFGVFRAGEGSVLRGTLLERATASAGLGVGNVLSVSVTIRTSVPISLIVSRTLLLSLLTGVILLILLLVVAFCHN